MVYKCSIHMNIHTHMNHYPPQSINGGAVVGAGLI
jgi:hypothetical protein